MPSINEINLVGPFITKASESEVIDIIYRQLKELIEKEKEKQKLKPAQGGRRRKKTLRKKYKKQNSRRLKHAKHKYISLKDY